MTTTLITNALLSLTALTALLALVWFTWSHLPTSLNDGNQPITAANDQSTWIPQSLADCGLLITDDALFVDSSQSAANAPVIRGVRGMWSRPRDLGMPIESLSEELARLHPDRGHTAALTVAHLVHRELHSKTDRVSRQRP